MTTSVRVEVMARVPDAGHPGDAVYLTGDLPALGRWRPDAVTLERVGQDEFHGEFDVPRDHEFEFKFTRGTWNSVEKNSAGNDIPNRKIRAESGTLIIAHVDRWGYDGSAPVTSMMRTHRAFHSMHLKNRRDLRVYLPPGYAFSSSRRYPVLYMHDGQNLFDPATAFGGVHWRVRETADELINNGRIEPLIIVGIDNTPERIRECTPSVDSHINAGGSGGKYMRFLIDEVKPFIDSRYRTMPDRAFTGIAGSSLGGLISLHACAEQPSLFGRCAAISPSLWWNGHDFIERLQTDKAWLRDTRLWLDMGTAESSTISAATGHSVHCTRELATFLQRAAQDISFVHQYHEIEGGEHNERSWADRFGRVLQFLYGTPNQVASRD